MKAALGMPRRSEPTRYQLTMLGALQHLPRVHEGTADPAAVARRRAANRRARAARRAGRRSK